MQPQCTVLVYPPCRSLSDRTALQVTQVDCSRPRLLALESQEWGSPLPMLWCAVSSSVEDRRLLRRAASSWRTRAAATAVTGSGATEVRLRQEPTSQLGVAEIAVGSPVPYRQVASQLLNAYVSEDLL